MEAVAWMRAVMVNPPNFGVVLEMSILKDERWRIEVTFEVGLQPHRPVILGNCFAS